MGKLISSLNTNEPSQVYHTAIIHLFTETTVILEREGTTHTHTHTHKSQEPRGLSRVAAATGLFCPVKHRQRSCQDVRLLMNSFALSEPESSLDEYLSGPEGYLAALQTSLYGCGSETSRPCKIWGFQRLIRTVLIRHSVNVDADS